ncbi:hypothetical protein AAGS40_29780 (plasmid) [Paraburkholderia sp. PREW-6R]|uniref:hypothetical protein n=1 Tax=Paraburkholderia sp. PREW-6R TaxID=3141544 RepID=UPI0031F5BE25
MADNQLPPSAELRQRPREHCFTGLAREGNLIKYDGDVIYQASSSEEAMAYYAHLVSLYA